MKPHPAVPPAERGGTLPPTRREDDVGELSAWHWAVVLVVAVMLFGSRRLPDAARSVGRSVRILRAELRGGTEPEPHRGDPEQR
jgi:sec-independent protein translocase protein TatA